MAGLRLVDDALEEVLKEALRQLVLSEESCRYITFLRDPIEKAISAYYFRGMTALQRFGSLRNALLHGHHAPEALQLSDDFVRRLSGFVTVDGYDGRGMASSAPLEGVSYEMLQNAARHLTDSFDVVGILEHMDESLEVAQATFRLGPLRIERQMEGLRECVPVRARPSSSSCVLHFFARDRHSKPVEESTRKLIEERNYFDLLLYRHACALLDAHRLELKLPPLRLEANRGCARYGGPRLLKVAA